MFQLELYCNLAAHTVEESVVGFQVTRLNVAAGRVTWVMTARGPRGGTKGRPEAYPRRLVIKRPAKHGGGLTQL